MKDKDRADPLTDAVFRFVPLLFFLATWHVLCSGDQRRMFLFATPGRVANRFWEDLTAGVLAFDSLITASEAIVGFLLATMVGTVVGILLASWPRISDIVAPYLKLLGAIPVYALAPMTIIWFGIGFWQKAGISFLSCVFVATNQSFHGASHPPDDQLLVFRAFRATSWQILWKLRLPIALAWVAAGCRLNVGFAILGAFLGEIISSNAGLGHYIMKASSLYDVPRVLSGVLALLILAYMMDRIVSAVFVTRGRSLVN